MTDIMRVRASSWSGLFDCAFRWEGIHLLGIRNTVGMKAIMGTALHHSTAAFDQARIDHSGVTPDDTAGIIVDTLADPGENYEPNDNDPTRREAERICLALHGKYCVDWSPRYEWEQVEMTTEPYEIACGDVTISLTGTLDRSRVRRLHGTEKRGIIDLKSGTRAIIKGRANTSQHKAQLGTYELLAEHTLGVPIDDVGGIIGLKTSGKPDIAEGEIKGAKQALIGTDDSPGLIEYAAQMFRTGMFPPNPSSIVCSPNYCPRWATCQFHT